MKRLFSGIQPTGELHLGNYLGAIKQWVEYQNDYEASFMIADLHTLTIHPESEVLRRQTLDLVAMLVALGINPKTAPIFLQSQISAHSELAWILSNFISIGALNRMTQFKEKSDRLGQLTGLLTYPVLQTADIALYQAEVVPVGEDQVQHLELSREIIRSFNNFAGKEVLVEPQPLLTNNARIMALNDPTKKMSKSIPGSAIGLLASEAEIAQTVKRAVTDSDPSSNEIGLGVKNLFMILEGISSHERVEQFEQMHKNGTLRYSELKEELIEDLVKFLVPIQKAYRSLRQDESVLVSILENSRKLTVPVAVETLSRVKSSLGLLT